MKHHTYVTTSLVWLLIAPLALAHHLPPEMQEIDEFGDETLRSKIIHPLTSVEHWLAAIGIVAAVMLVYYLLTKRRPAQAIN